LADADDATYNFDSVFMLMMLIKNKICFEGIHNSRLHRGQRSGHRSKDPSNQHLGRNSGLELKTSTTTTTTTSTTTTTNNNNITLGAFK
jgi:hypothetical protein